MTRLKTQQYGQWINPETTVDFSFEGQTIKGVEGDTVASALLANDQWLLSRSFKYHRPRGVLTLCGDDANTLIQTPDAPNLLADRLAVKDGLETRGQNYWGSLYFDLNRLLDWMGRFLPVGFYYKAFYKPFGIWRLWEPVVRQAAGLGIANLGVKPPYTDKIYRFCDVAVIGAGPAGLNAALTAAEAGASVLLIEREPHLGGALNYHRFNEQVDKTLDHRDALIDRVTSHANIDVMTSATCNAWFTDHYLPVIQGDRLHKVRAKQCILATGASEQHAVFRNNDLPGILLCSALDRLSRLYGVIPKDPVVVLAGNDLAYQTAFTAQDAGAEIAAIIDMRSADQGSPARDEATSRGIKVIPSAAIAEAGSSITGHRLTQITVKQLDNRGALGDTIETIRCSVLAMSAGFMPAYQLACQAGASLRYDDDAAEFEITQLPEGMHLAGSVNSKHSLAAVEADGRNAAGSALRALSLPAKDAEQVDCHEAVNHLWPIFKHPKGREFIDFDEDLQIKDIINAARMGYRDIQLVKRFSTVGMGPSQGRHSALPTARLIAKATDRSVTETGVTTARPPVTPEPLSLVAGRRFHPLRRTPMHRHHLRLGAQMMPAGAWQRPAYYGNAPDRLKHIAAEAEAVRTNVGIIDVSTLGGIELRGPDAAEFMNRLYTFGFIKQPVGKTRYAVLTNEHGVVVDDGVAARLADDHYYVTATTGGVDRVYRDMLKWNAQWRLSVDIANVTTAFAAVNVAGPNSRQVLEAAGCDIDLGVDAFPYLAYREARIADIPVRMMRVGFVGELGFELHMPALMAASLWERLIDAGANIGIRPFGVEAQRLLRLEKGHIIVGQDTDGMTHPDEVALTWAISKQKPFFVGSRSVDILSKLPLERQLVGFSLSPEAPQPKEGHLVINEGDIAGSVTSCEYSPTLKRIIGLAYVHPETSSPGAEIIIRTDNAVHVHAHVESLPFYDPNNERQAL